MMRAKSPIQIKPPFSSRSLRYVNKNINRRLPFSLNDPVTREAMNLSNITVKDLEILPLQHFLNIGPTDEIGKMNYQRHLEHRNELIKLIQNNIELVNKSHNNHYTNDNNDNDDNDSSFTNIDINNKRKHIKDSGELVYERHMAEVNISLLNEKEKNDQAILRRLAIIQMRQALKQEKNEKINEKVDRLSKLHSDKLTETLANARFLTENSKFEARSPGSHEECLHCQKMNGLYQTRDSEERENNYKNYIEQRNKKYLDEVNRSNARIANAKNHQEKYYDNMISHRLERVNLTDHRQSLIKGKFEERDRKFNERGEKRAIHIQDVHQRGCEVEQNRVRSALMKLEIQEQKAQQAMKRRQDNIQQRIETERKIFEKRNSAAKKTLSARRNQIDELGRLLDEKDAKLETRLMAIKTQEAQNLQQIRSDLEEKTAKILNAKRAIDCANICSLRQKLLRNSAGIEEVRSKRARSQMAKLAEGTKFSEKRMKVLSLMPQMIHASDEERIQLLVDILDITEEEAIEMLNIARSPSSLH